MHAVKRAASVAACLAVSVAALAGCGDKDKNDGAAPAGQSTQAAATATATDQAGEQSGPDSLGAVAGTRTVKHDGATWKLDVYAPRRSGGTVQLNLKVTLVAPPADRDEASIYNLLNSGSTDRIYQPDGIRLIDGAGKKAYLVALQDRTDCFCAPKKLADSLQKGDQTIVSTIFAAPPESTQAVDIEVPTFGTFPHVAFG